MCDFYYSAGKETILTPAGCEFAQTFFDFSFCTLPLSYDAGKGTQSQTELEAFGFDEQRTFDA